MTDKKTSDSFLHEIQREGHASGKVEIGDLDKAIEAMTHVLDKDAAEFYRQKPEDDWPTAKMVIYCHDCRAIVTPGVGKTLRGKPRTVCGECTSKKISMGREEALEKFYHLKDRAKKEKEKK